MDAQPEPPADPIVTDPVSRAAGRSAPPAGEPGENAVGVGVALGAGTGMIVGLLLTGGPGISLGLAMGAAAGLLVAVVRPALRARWTRLGRHPAERPPR